MTRRGGAAFPPRLKIGVSTRKIDDAPDTGADVGHTVDDLREGLRSAVALPIHVDGRLWGAIAVGSGQGPLPPDTEQRMTEFTDLVATAVANAQNRPRLRPAGTNWPAW